MTNKAFTFNKTLAKELLDELGEGFSKTHPRFIAFLEGITDETKELKLPEYSGSRKNSKGHRRVADLYKELFPSHRIEENVSLSKLDIGTRLTNVEFDVVNFTQRVIIEIDGQHHKKYVPHFHKNLNAFREQKKRDNAKEEWCHEHGWTLIRINDEDAKKLWNKGSLEEVIKGALSG